MKIWEYWEKEAIRISGGKGTPGSGNKSIRGDVWFPGSNDRIEVKSTENLTTINIQSKWLRTLEGMARSGEVCLVVGFGNHTGHVYYHYADKNDVKEWSTMKVDVDNMPDQILMPDSTWIREDLSSLYSWRD